MGWRAWSGTKEFLTSFNLGGRSAARKSRAARALAVFALACAVLLGVPAEAAPSADPASAATVQKAEALVSHLNEGLLQIMKTADSQDFAARVKLLTPYIDQAFDMRILSANTIGPTQWNEWSEQQKTQYVAAFTAFLTASYVNQFDSYSGQSFEVTDAEAQPRGLVYVKSQLNRPNKEPVLLSYLVADRNDKDGIIDVFFDNVSEVARRRSELGGVYAREGFDALLATLNNKTEQLAAGIADTPK